MTANTQKTEAPRPIQDWENREVKDQALIGKDLLEARIARTTELRQRQEAYDASLPKDPIEALDEINMKLKELYDLSRPEYATRAALEIIHQLATHHALDDSEALSDALFWLTNEALDGLKIIEDKTRRAANIASQFHPSHKPFEA